VSRFLILRACTRFRGVKRASGPVFLFCAPGHVFGGTDGVGSRFHVLRIRLYRGCQLPFSCFALSFSTIPTVSCLVFMFCTPGLIFGGIRTSGTVFMFYAPGLAFGGTEGVRSLFHVYRARTRFRWYRGRRLPLSCFALPDTFSAVPRASVPVFMFCLSGLVFGCTEGVGSRFHVLRSQTIFRWYRGHRDSFSCFTLPNSFSAVSGRRLQFSCFARLDSLSAVPRASALIFMFCAPGLIFRRYRGRCVSFSCFARPDSISGFSRASGPVFLFCAPEQVFGGTEGVESRFHVLRSRTIFRWYRGRRVLF
jgi:hypothetical protein